MQNEKKETYKVKVRYTFNVEYTFNGPKTDTEAEEWAKTKVAMTSAGLTSSLSEEQCDWNNDVHAEKTIVRIQKNKLW